MSAFRTHPAALVAAGLDRWILSTIAMLLGAALLVFGMQAIVPGDPALALLQAGGGPLPSPEQIAAKRREIGIDRPFLTRYVDWLGDVVHGDFGRSWTKPADVADLIGPRLGTTMGLAITAILIAMALTAASGVFAALRPDSLTDRLTRMVVVVMIAIPSFVIGLLVLQFVVVDLGLGQVLATTSLTGAMIPALILGAVMAAGWSRPFRAIMRDATTAPQMVVARARGMSRTKATLRIALPAGLLEFMPFIGLAVGGALGATMLIEVVFSWPGAAAFAVEAARRRDMPVIQAFTLVSVTMFRLSTDLLSAARWSLDPRVRTHEGTPS